MIHKGCGGMIREDETRGYKYCSTHGGECEGPDCPHEAFYPALICIKCGQEIGGDAEIDMEYEE
jgi:hypothetical protein